MAHVFLMSCRLLVLFLVLTANNAGLCRSQGDGAADGSRGRALVPAMFVFGDSLIDNGNNNDLPSLAKANYFPYGIDFNGGPTGRFSNGYTMVDTIAELLGLPLIPSHSQASGDQMRYGVNYASAAAGILDDTGRNFVSRIPFNQQIKNFESNLDQITGRLGALDVAQELSRCIFFIGMGSNDYLNNYLMPNYDTKNHYNGQQYADLLVKQYSQQLTRLYNLGARRFVIAGLGLMGCIPSILAQGRINGGCSDDVNNLIVPFNTNTKAMINDLSTNLPGVRFSYIDIHSMFQDLLANSRSYGFLVVNRGCCGIGRNRGQITCLPFETPCPNRNRYIFWDAFHPTEAVNILLGKKAFNGDTDVVYPINIEQLASL
ncbi:GDSL-like Lipase/Acylhydrolase superfamily protein [Perilla frutescens var. hirtella]|uniref:GDSL-like Lipase/Acylhydrolase superfamily protein n=1 Tax=Perilla frutescens var. hirtella TaxID=608512 RepID=A0AAD4JIG0_PERFH|nr:GDSL-like Lipase/Acylhydrolase superfamily protein [Perilla frutescens var. hirtella]KAH6834021.1 GDSL-like Lipase/Acylhydrolase superfamily protein [Perilla frutescens var. hirtella]